ncbi:acyl-homoserine-lactone synthase TraI [Rhizobium glycinendophyticum]|uniref:Acyl-homoserine-lactone synthase n=1 Tax=Rhizobium glycinendophyticum TaxID=2589807 RepID=A0A504U6G0_9HYPH|nr:acyl-homoserine-lactone synthase TraI [Rhizobium glycinendophyticum]TPP06015.1 GNAT family N-acetyltransferase [Rhizobium glycinendophyticum]
MRIVAITKPKNEPEHCLIHEMQRLRARVFCGRLAWNVPCTSGLEVDSFDELNPTYILCLDCSDAVIGCARLLPATNGTMLEKVFPQLLENAHLRTHARMIESSRFCVDTKAAGKQQQAGLHTATLAMFAGIVEWSILNGYSEVVTATDVRLERILRRAGWPLKRLGSPVQINETRSIAGVLPANWESFDRLRPGIYSSNLPISKKEVV